MVKKAKQEMAFEQGWPQCILSNDPVKVGISGYGNLQTMSMNKWAPRSTQLSTNVWVKLLLLLENALKLNF